MGGAFLSLLDTLRTAITVATSMVPGGLHSLNARGVEDTLMALKDGSGHLSTVQKADGGLVQAGFNPVDAIQVTSASTVIPIDPVTMGIAIAIDGIEKKLDEIQEAQQQILSFVMDVEKSRLSGNLSALEETRD